MAEFLKNRSRVKPDSVVCGEFSFRDSFFRPKIHALKSPDSSLSNRYRKTSIKLAVYNALKPYLMAPRRFCWVEKEGIGLIVC
jgi:hypothetical protein